tara:strand:+ start:179 stop:544 length:366 start_codon:yes stop_codon:yes gene_type:complete
MSIKYTWSVRNVFLETTGSTDPAGEDDGESVDTTDLTKFIQSIGVTITGTDGTVTSSHDTVAQLYHNPEGAYIDYENITTANLITWAKAAIGNEVTTSIESQIHADILSKASATGTVDWVS